MIPTSLVTSAELTEMQPDESLISALRRTRPWFLGSARSKPMVVIDGGPATDVSILETLLVSEVAEVSLERASSSAGRYGVASDGRVIVGDLLLVRTRSRR